MKYAFQSNAKYVIVLETFHTIGYATKLKRRLIRLQNQLIHLTHRVI